MARGEPNRPADDGRTTLSTSSVSRTELPKHTSPDFIEKLYGKVISTSYNVIERLYGKILPTFGLRVRIL
jgi:hypothetical protein